MPELPEVEWWCRTLEQWACGHSLRNISILDERLIAVPPKESEVLVGQRIAWVRRRGKLGLIGFEDHVLLFHLRMTGQWMKESDGRKAKRVRAALELDNGERLLFDDIRCLGTLEILAMNEWEDAVARRGLGPEPWPMLRDDAWWRARLAGRRCAIKPALMRQDWVSGLGNIAGSEICFRAGIDPRRLTSTLDDVEWRKLASGVRDYINTTLQETDELEYISQGGHNPFLVYGKSGPCAHCGGSIKRFKQAGRGTWFCDVCQD